MQQPRMKRLTVMGTITLKSPFMIAVFCFALCTLSSWDRTSWGQSPIRLLNFQGDSGFQHDSKDEAISMVEMLARKNGWQFETSFDPADISTTNLAKFDVVVFNNNCGTDKRIFSDDQHDALKAYIRGGGGFVGIHCAGAIWHEGEKFQDWYEKLIGTRLVAHPHVQEATLIVENRCHHCTAHLPEEWTVKDEWHKFSYNPREHVNVLISLDESTYDGDPSLKMGGDHPFTWYQYYDGGRSFFTSLGHTEEVYADANFQRLVEGGIEWAAGRTPAHHLPVSDGLILDLDAERGVETDAQNQVTRWTNQVTDFAAQDFVINDYGVRLERPGSGSPELIKADAADKHDSIAFREDELINFEEDAFDHLLTGSGYTWFAVLKPYATPSADGETEFGMYRLRDVNAFLGNLRNGGNYEGLWACFDDDLTFWCGSRSGVTFGRFDENNPKLSGPKLIPDRFYVLAARMGAGHGSVPIEIFVNSSTPANSLSYPVSVDSNPSKMAIGTERDATNHPGSESFDGEISRVLMFERPLPGKELEAVMNHLITAYGVQTTD